MTKPLTLIVSLMLTTLFPSSSAQYYLDEFSDANQANFEHDPYATDPRYKYEKSLKDHHATESPFYKAKTYDVQNHDDYESKRGAYYGRITLDDHEIPVYVIKSKKKLEEEGNFDGVKPPPLMMEHKTEQDDKVYEKEYFYPGYKKHLQKFLQKIDAVKNLAKMKLMTEASRLFGYTTSFIKKELNDKLPILVQKKDVKVSDHEHDEGRYLDPRRTQDYFGTDGAAKTSKVFKDKDLKHHDYEGLKNIPLNGVCDKGFKKDVLGVCRFVWN